MTDSAALLKRKYMIVKFLIDREFITFFIQTEAQTHVAQEVPVSSRLMALSQEDSRLPRRVSPRPSVRYGPEPARASPLWRRASRASQVRPRAGLPLAGRSESTSSHELSASAAVTVRPESY